MAFLITSPLINEIAMLLLVSLLGWKFTVLYVLVGMVIVILSGWFLDPIGAECWLQPLAAKAVKNSQRKSPPAQHEAAVKMTLADRHSFAKGEMLEIVARVWKWVFIGVGIGAALHSFVPDGWIEAHLGQGQWWSVSVSVLVGIPLYSNATGVMSTPGVVMDEKVVHSSGVPATESIKNGLICKKKFVLGASPSTILGQALWALSIKFHLT
ncbi:MAG: uncharacterized membrane protein YraQ (UPF0718 family) [Psychromonas sp.]|jgi:uncharacterized membrane protein YraQ (UPF0718 family)